MTVAIIVLNHDGTEDTLECLRSLRAVTFPGSRIYLVDNGSRPPIAPSLPRQGQDIRLLESPENLGFTGGSNWAAREALAEGARYLLFLNNDATVAPGFLEPLVGALDADPRIGIATPKIYFHGQDRVIWACGARLNSWIGRSVHVGVYRPDRGQYDRLRRVDRVTGCAMLVRRDFVDRVGLLDDRFFAYGEDVDWCLRGRRHGYRMAFVPDSIVWHRGHRTAGRLGRPFIRYLKYRNPFLLLRKNAECFVAGGSLALSYLVLGLSFGTAASALRGETDSARAAWRGFRDGLRGRFGPPPRDLGGRRP